MKRSSELRRTDSLKRTPGPARTASLRPQSAKRRRDNRERADIRKCLYEERGPLCEVGIPNVCDGRWTDLHERLSRARGGSITEAANIVLACRPCHTVITENPAWAEANGWALPSWGAA